MLDIVVRWDINDHFLSKSLYKLDGNRIQYIYPVVVPWKIEVIGSIIRLSTFALCFINVLHYKVGNKIRKLLDIHSLNVRI